MSQLNTKKFIRDAADAMSVFITQIQDMDRHDLEALIRECDALTSTNCWWLEHRLAPLLKQEAEEALSFKPATTL